MSKLNTTQLRKEWAPACTGPFAKIGLHGAGVVTVRADIIDAVRALNNVLIKYNYKTRAADTGAFVCLAGETEIITRNGVMPISELDGEEVEILTRRSPTGNAKGGPGKWVKSEIRHFSDQPLRKITLGSGLLTKEIYATPDHRWYVRNEDMKHISEVTTDNLRPADGRLGHRLLSVYPQSVASRTTPSPVGISAGIVFGDGTLDAYGSRVALYGEKNISLLKYFSPEQKRYEYHYDTHADPHVIVTGLPKSWKTSGPNLNDGSPYLYGWLAGYFAADGRVTKSGAAELNSTNKDALELARNVALRLGIATRPITSTVRDVVLPGKTESISSTIYSLRFISKTLDSSFFLIQDHKERFDQEKREKEPHAWRVLSVEETDRVEKVFCAVVPETECFVLADYILTGNCRAITGGTGYSLHAYGIAIDINWQSNPYGKKLITDMPIAMVNEIKAIRTKSGAQVWGWGGDYGTNKDAMHFEIVCTRAAIASGIAGTITKPPVVPTPEEEDDMEYKDWSDASKKALIEDIRKALLYDITGSRPADPNKGPWTNLGDVINEIKKG